MTDTFEMRNNTLRGIYDKVVTNYETGNEFVTLTFNLDFNDTLTICAGEDRDELEYGIPTRNGAKAVNHILNLIKTDTLKYTTLTDLVRSLGFLTVSDTMKITYNDKDFWLEKESDVLFWNDKGEFQDLGIIFNEKS